MHSLRPASHMKVEVLTQCSCALGSLLPDSSYNRTELVSEKEWMILTGCQSGQRL